MHSSSCGNFGYAHINDNNITHYDVSKNIHAQDIFKNPYRNIDTRLLEQCWKNYIKPNPYLESRPLFRNRNS